VFPADVDACDAFIAGGAKKAEHGGARDWEVLEKPRNRVGVEQFLRGPRLRLQQVVLERFHEGKDPFLQTGLDGCLHGCLSGRRPCRPGSAAGRVAVCSSSAATGR